MRQKNNTSKKGASKKRLLEKRVEEVEGISKPSPHHILMTCSTWIHTLVPWKKPTSSPKVSRLTNMLSSIIEMMDMLEAKVDRLEAKLCLPEEYCNALKGVMDMIDSKLDQQITKGGKINSLTYHSIIAKVIHFGNIFVVKMLGIVMR